MNLAAVVRINANNLGSKAATLFHDEVLTYAQLWRGIESVAAFLADAGVGEGDRVGLALKDHPLHVMAHFAIARLDAVILPMDHRWTGAEKQAAAAAFDAAIVLTDGESIEQTRTRTLDASALNHDTSALPAIRDGGDRDLLISLSSGTTGKPKGALVTHRNLYERFVSQWAAIGYDSRDCFAVLTPLFFGAGRSFAMSLLAAGGTIRIAPPPMSPDEIVAVLKDPRVTATFLPPTLLRRLLPMHEDGTPPLLGNLDYLLVSGEPLYADEAHQCLEKICPKLCSYYASSEGGGISVLPASDFADFAATVGIPTFRTDVEIVDENDAVLEPGTVGRLRYRGPGVATRFLDSDGVEQQSSGDGWFYPGDLAERLETGHIALRGRDKDVIIRGGVNVYPAEIEATLLQHGDVLEAAVVGVDDAGRGQAVLAYVATSGPLTDQQLEAYCRDKLAPYKVPQAFHLVEALPKKASGKVDKKALSALLQT